MGAHESSDFLIAAIGNSDIRVATSDPPEAAGHCQRKSPVKARLVGKALLERLERGDAVEYDLPLLEPVVQELDRVGQRPPRIVFVASDQPESTPENHRDSDTLHYAELAARRLCSVFQFPPDAIQIVAFTGNPADYGQTFPFIRRCLAGLRGSEQDPPFTCHLAPTGGTPALSAALIAEGVAAFGSQARVHYVDRGAATARAVDVVSDLQAQSLRRALMTHIDAHAYAAAGALCDTDPAFDTLLPDNARRGLFRALIQHATHRLNANLAGASEALFGIDLGALAPEERGAVTLLQRSATEEELDAQTIREVIASAEVMFELEHYFDFITRVATFMDTACRYVAVHHFGAQLHPDPSDSDRDTLESWIRQNPELCSYLTKKKVRFTGPPSQFVYKRVVGFMARSDSTRASVANALNNPQLEALADLRNACVHRYNEITPKRLQDSWQGDPNEILAGMRHLAEIVGVTDTTRNPYATIQHTLRRLLEHDD